MSKKMYLWQRLLLGGVLCALTTWGFAQNEGSTTLLNKPAPKIKYLITYSRDNQQSETLTSLSGKAHLVFFWSPANWGSLSLIAELNKLYEDFRGNGLEIIACQSPGYQFEIDNGEAESNIRSYQMLFPVIIDDGWKTYRAFKNTTWPVIFLTDQSGIVKNIFRDKIDYRELKSAIEDLLNQPNL